ncbi:MAG: creatininase family protein [Rubrivivax sp.]
MTNRLVALAALLFPLAAFPATVLLEEMTSPELAARVAAGTTTALVPVGGTEQNGPHMVLGKHNRRSLLLATAIAEKLGHAVVAPVLAYVPEGAIDPPTQHMKWPGTISVPEAAFESVLEGAARSLCRHGLTDVFFLGDHGGYQAAMARAAERTNRGAKGGCRAHALAEYYRVTQTDYVKALKAEGVAEAELGSHAGLADTSLALAVDPALVRLDAARNRKPGAADGATGDTRRSSAEWGRLGTQRIVEASVAAIEAALKQTHPKGKE